LYPKSGVSCGVQFKRGFYNVLVFTAVVAWDWKESGNRNVIDRLAVTFTFIFLWGVGAKIEVKKICFLFLV
jgi:hypothetical protein